MVVTGNNPTLAEGARTRLRWLALAALCWAELLVFVDNTIVNVALPTIAKDLGANNSGLQWVVDMYTLVFAGLLLTGGYLGDRFGRRLILLVGVVGFMAFSAVAAVSGSLGQLIGARAGLGLFAALVFPATLAIVVVIFDDLTERALAVALWAAVAGVAAAIGPVLGGWLLEHFSWGSIFWANLPAGLLALILIPILVPPNKNTDAQAFDLGGVLLSTIGVALFVYSVIEAPNHGWSSLRTIAGIAVGAGVIAVFAAWEHRKPNALFDVRLFADRRFAAAALLMAFGFFALMGFVFLVTQYFQAVKGYSPLETGIRTLPFAIVMAVLAGPSMWLADKLGSGRTAACGSLVLAVGFWLTVQYGVDTSYWRVIVVAMSTMAAGVAMISGPATLLVLNELSAGQAGAGAAVNDTSREIGGTLGVAVLGSILASVYSSTVGRDLADAPLTADVREAAQSSVMAGVQIAHRLPAPLGARADEVVKDAFIAGFHCASWVAGAVSAAAAVAGLWVFERAGRRAAGARAAVS
ncbi:DHA2 family efflux MFS transporter permease subunit [Mycobacterium sp. TNTM28]|uniref:DHA2 family efflux MFS transporter permease subunit n=1 Tax=[Mycobacterium] fortunisiensis TaxID=2600579 RepID=A0ABS6KP81_9MYCO|nr:DHA2 family efflux MFS transporter permease subunit [[Mycobacterium] fortunisiensis]MBU9765416.1 DHA2 family efflux MFS transporter permease subunit [[Mycobacterium] fortunisiensis]